MVEYEFRHVFARILLTALILGPTDLWCLNSSSTCFLSCVGPNLNQQTFEIETKISVLLHTGCLNFDI